MGCLCAIKTDEYHGFECSVSGGACMYLYPDSKRCAREYGEGPDVGDTEEYGRIMVLFGGYGCYAI